MVAFEGTGGKHDMTDDTFQQCFDEMRRAERHGTHEWPPSNLEPEARWHAHGLECMVLKGPLGTLNGYVRVPTSHSDAMRLYSEVDIDVHGGLTFGMRVANGRWFGFDTAHVGDYVPDLGRMSRRGPGSFKPHHWTLDAVKAETDQLARQLAARANASSLCR